MSTLYLDLETFSKNPLTFGVYKYSEAAEIMLFAYAIDNGPVRVVDCTKESIPDELNDAYDNCEYVCAHNSNFDRVILNVCFRKREHGWRDTMIRALAHGLPGGLDLLCQIYKLPEDKAKLKDGRKLVHLFCKPKPDGSRNTSKTHPKEWAQFVKYAGMDIVSMRELDKKLPTWNDTNDERTLWYLDQIINDRGFIVDTSLAECAVRAVSGEKTKRDARTKDKTSGAVNSATQRDAMLKHILEIYGVELPDMQISTLTRRLNDDNLPEPVKELIALRLESSGTATKKYVTLLSAVCKDGRLRGTLQFSGASRTSRWGGRVFQPQNLPRPKFKAAEVEFGIEAIKNEVADLIYDNVTEVASSAIRGVIVAPPGKKLVVSDLSSIEGRKLAWLASETWKLQAYVDYDKGSGYDMYVLTYCKTFNYQPEDVDKKKRQLGKVLELALGYGGGVGAFMTFARNFNIDLNELADGVWDLLPSRIKNEAKALWAWAEEKKKTHALPERTFVALDGIKRMWREANPNIVDFWGRVEDAVRSVIGSEKNGEVIVNSCKIDRNGRWVRIRLPSGRYICYAGACIDDNQIKYLGINQYTRKWCRMSTYSGKLVENITQASSRDILAYGMKLAEAKGYEVVLHVHDELITEVSDTAKYSAKDLSAIMSTNPPWARGLPLAAAGFEGYRYKKED